MTRPERPAARCAPATARAAFVEADGGGCSSARGSELSTYNNYKLKVNNFCGEFF